MSANLSGLNLMAISFSVELHLITIYTYSLAVISKGFACP
ncbi:hypothetical protein SAMN05660489_04703 [Pseudomonas sp. LAMO17WK12:I10]|nr:hypothetical protein H160_05048 [Pseudomonas sp. LAMO17WK12:I9]SNY47705.1 hypothetical protein SAMN05660489_04703 [Pseudomonas sp. LAMO17WK12:I10]